MQDETIYRCVNPACARLMPRPVKFCPWCGTAQAGAQVPKPAPAPASASASASGSAFLENAPEFRPVVEAKAEPARAPVNASAAAAASDKLSGWSDLPPAPAPPPPPPAADWGKRGAGPAGARAGTDAHASARATPPDTGFGHGAGPRERAPEQVPRPPIPPKPARPQREPVRLRWWLLVLAILWGVWLLAKPNAGRRIEQRIDHAVALAQACKAHDAQDELIALRKTRATPDQLERLQASLNDAASACTRKRQRDKAWGEASAAAEAALADGNAERAYARLQAFTRRWGEDERSRALRARIDDARHPLAAPSG